MKSALFDVSRGVKECDESEKYTHFARESDVLRLVEELCRLVKNYSPCWIHFRITLVAKLCLQSYTRGCLVLNDSPECLMHERKVR